MADYAHKNQFADKQNENESLDIESRNSERAFNSALGFADNMFFQGHYVF